MMIEGDVVDGVVRHAVELKGAAALGGDEGEGVVFGVDCRVAVAAGEVAGADVAVCAVGVLVVGRVEVGPEAEVLAVGLLVGAEVEGGFVEGVVVVDGGVATGVDVAGGEGRGGVEEFDMRSEDDAVEEHGLDDLVGAGHEEVPVAGEGVLGGSVGVEFVYGEDDVRRAVFYRHACHHKAVGVLRRGDSLLFGEKVVVVAILKGVVIACFALGDIDHFLRPVIRPEVGTHQRPGGVMAVKAPADIDSAIFAKVDLVADVYHVALLERGVHLGRGSQCAEDHQRQEQDVFGKCFHIVIVFNLFFSIPIRTLSLFSIRTFLEVLFLFSRLLRNL